MCTFFQTGREEERNNNNNNNKATTTTSTKYMRFHGFLLFCTHKILWSWILLKFCTAVGFFFYFFFSCSLQSTIHYVAWFVVFFSLFYLFIYFSLLIHSHFISSHSHSHNMYTQTNKMQWKKAFFIYIFVLH